MAKRKQSIPRFVSSSTTDITTGIIYSFLSVSILYTEILLLYGAVHSCGNDFFFVCVERKIYLYEIRAWERKRFV